MRLLLAGAVFIAAMIAVAVLFFRGTEEVKTPVVHPLPFPSVHVTYADTNFIKGYFFIAPFKMTKSGSREKCAMMILDNCGAVAWCKAFQESSNFQIQPNGMMSYFGHGKYYIMNNSFVVIDSVACINGAETDAHEFKILDNGHYMLIGIKSANENHSDFSIDTPIVWRGGKNMLVKYNVIQELDQNKNLVYEWSTQGHFDLKDVNPVFLQDTGKIDIPHLNAFFIDSTGNFLLTARYTDEVVYVDKKSGAVQWRFGGKRSDFKITGEPYPFVTQHDARILSNGNILLFDNGFGLKGSMHPARSVEYALNKKTMTATPAWSYSWSTSLISESTGNTQRLSNGETLVSFGKILDCNPNILCVVTDSLNNIHYQVELPDTMATYRTYYYPSLPFSLNRPRMHVMYDPDDKGNSVVVMSSLDGDSCLWSNGIFAPSITVDQPGTYQYFVKNPDGSYTGSYAMVVNSTMVGKP